MDEENKVRQKGTAKGISALWTLEGTPLAIQLPNMSAELLDDKFSSY